MIDFGCGCGVNFGDREMGHDSLGFGLLGAGQPGWLKYGAKADSDVLAGVCEMRVTACKVQINPTNVAVWMVTLSPFFESVEYTIGCHPTRGRNGLLAAHIHAHRQRVGIAGWYRLFL